MIHETGKITNNKNQVNKVRKSAENLRRNAEKNSERISGQNPSSSLRMMVFSSLFTVLMIFSGYISFPIPLSPVPIVLSDFFAMLAGLFLGAAWGCASVGLYLFLGTLGFPVFAGGKAGLIALCGPTGGFLFGYLISALAVGIISRGKASSKKTFLPLKDLSALLAGNILLYAAGISWLKILLKITWKESLTLGLIPFIPGAIVKTIVSIVLMQAISPSLTQLIANTLQD